MSTITATEQAEIDDANESGRPPVVFVHNRVGFDIDDANVQV